MLRLSEWEEQDMDCEKSNQVYSLLMENTPLSRRDKKSTYVNRRSFGTIQKNKMLPLVTGSPFGSPGATSSSFHNSRAQSSDHTLQMQTFMSETTENMYQFQDTLNGLTMLEPTEEITSTTAVLLAKEDPDLHVTGSLCQDFLDVYMSYPGEHEIFDLLLQYESLCSQSAEQLIRITRKAASAQQKLKKAIIALRMLQEERNSWRLIRILFQDRLEVENMEDNEILMDTLGKKVDDKQIVENLYQRNSFVRQCQLVVDWLEKNAADDFDDIYFDKLEHFSDHCVAWEHTLHDLQSFGSEFDLPTRSMIITEMDPDAPIRQQNKILNNIDKEDEARLLKYMFVSIRAGALDQAQKLTEKFGQPWLAAALEGWRLYHDPNYSDDFNTEGDVLLPIEGNLYRDIWKTVCWRMSNDAYIPVYEKAIFATFSGNLKALLPACVNWEDHLWAYVRVLVDQHIEEELYSSTHQERSMEDLPPSYCEKLDMNQIFQELEASESEIVKKEGMSSMHIIQKYIIVDDIDGLIEEMCSWLQKSSCLNINLIRFMAHLVLFIRLIGRSKKEELCILILEAYVKELIKEHRVPIVAAYTATLPAAQQIVWYAKFLEGITDNTERQQCLQYAEEAGLDIPLITKTVVENMRGKDATVKEPIDSLTTETTEDDRQKIEAIDWLVFDPTQRGEAIRQANALMRIFVASKKIDAARQVFAKIPTDSLAIVMGQWTRMTGNNELCAEDDNAAREYLCFKAYLEACDGFNDWFHHFQHEKPKCPEPLVGDHIKFKDKVAHEHQVKQYEADLERWESSLWSQTKVTSDLLYNVLLFVSGGWMVDQRGDGILSEGRQKQMSLLRKLCIPQITLLLHSVLHNTEQYKECIQLADIISSEKNQLYKEFSVQELRNFMCMIRESSLALLNENLDPLGYSYE